MNPFDGDLAAIVQVAFLREYGDIDCVVGAVAALFAIVIGTGV